MEDGAAEGAETLPYFTVNSTAVPAYDAFCSAPVRCGKSACPGALDGPRDCQRPGYCLITSTMPMVWSVVFCVEAWASWLWRHES